MESKSIRVQIFGMEYSLKSDNSEEYVNEVAQYVDTKIRNLSENTTVKSQTKIAVLAALNIADELFRVRDKYSKALAKIDQKSEELSDSIDRYLEKKYTPMK